MLGNAPNTWYGSWIHDRKSRCPWWMGYPHFTWDSSTENPCLEWFGLSRAAIRGTVRVQNVIYNVASSPMFGRPRDPRLRARLFEVRTARASGVQNGECCLCYTMGLVRAISMLDLGKILTYFNPFKFLYLLLHTSHLNGFSFSMPSVPG